MPRFRFTSDSVVEIHAQSSMHPIEVETHSVTGEVDAEVDAGAVRLDPAPKGFVELPVEALESGHTLQDREMRRRVDAKQHPTIHYRLDEATGGPERFELLGTLTLHGQEQQFSALVTARVDRGALSVEGEHTFDIRDFGVKPPKLLGLQVSPEVRVVARLVARA